MDKQALPWLLEEENPSVRYFTLIHLLDRPEDDPQVAEARDAITNSKDVQAIFARQNPAGWWDTPERATGIKRASGQLLILSQLGVPANERTRRGCEFVLSKPWLPTRRPVCIVPCYTANCLRFLAYFGYGDDPRVEQGWRAMIERLERDDGLVCWYQKQRPCHWLAVKALWAFAAAPAAQEIHAAMTRTAEALLSHPFDFTGEEAHWLRFGFPWYFQSDLLDALEALAACGYTADPRFRALAHHVVDKQQANGRWLKEAGSTATRIERKGQPSKWITLKALRVLKKMKEAKMVDTTLAGACGLYCGACGIYRMYKDKDTERLEGTAREVFHCQPEDIRCEGCRGPFDCLWTPDCRFKTCTQDQGITFCYECMDFPCEELVAFSADRRDIPLSNLRRLAEVGLNAWLVEQEARWRCPACRKPVDIYSETCRACGAPLPH